MDLPVEFELIAWFLHITDYSIFFLCFFSLFLYFLLTLTWLFSSMNISQQSQGLGSRHCHKEPWSLNCFCYCWPGLHTFVLIWAEHWGLEALAQRFGRKSNPGMAVRKAGRSDLWFYSRPQEAPVVVFMSGPGIFHCQSRPLSFCVVSWKLCWKTKYFFLIEIWFAYFSLFLHPKPSVNHFSPGFALHQVSQPLGLRSKREWHW